MIDKITPTEAEKLVKKGEAHFMSCGNKHTLSYNGTYRINTENGKDIYYSEEYIKFVEFKKRIDKKDYDGASQMSLDDPKLKNKLSKKELINFVNHYEKAIKDMIIKSLRKANLDLNKTNSGLEKTLNEIEIGVDN